VSQARRRHTDATALPEWIPPQLTQLVDTAPDGDQWLHEIKYDGYRMHARLGHVVLAPMADENFGHSRVSANTHHRPGQITEYRSRSKASGRRWD
jgi:hypothetical protein